MANTERDMETGQWNQNLERGIRKNFATWFKKKYSSISNK